MTQSDEIKEKEQRELRFKVDDEPSPSIDSDAPRTSSPTDLSEAQRELEVLGLEDRYRVLELLGQGGMGSVYKVKDLTLDKTLAIKVLRKELATDKQAVRRFQQEASAASELTHMNLVPVYHNGQTDAGLPFLVMDYVDGESLAETLKYEKKISTKRGLDLFIQTVEALTHAHMKGIVHRDLKPSNIMITKTASGADLVHLLDFGIAKILPSEGAASERTNLTQTGDIFGSPLYMSPEQCQNNPQDVRSDIYAMGCVMYEALSGVQPFAAENPVKVILKHINDEPEPVSKLPGAQEIPKDLETVIGRCLEKDPKERYQTADALLADLRSIASGVKIRTKAKKKPVEKSSIRPKLVVLASCAAVAASFISILAFLIVMPGISTTFGTSKTGGLNPYTDARDLDSKSYSYFTSGQYEKAIPLLEFGISTYREQVENAKKTGKTRNLPRDEVLLAENLQHVGKCYLKLAEKAEAKKNPNQATEQYNLALSRYREALEIWKKYGNYAGSMMPEAVREYAAILVKLEKTDELDSLKTLAREQKISLPE